MIAAIHQPQYLPWVPYCAKAASCDVFVYLDTVDFQKHGVQNRNRIKTQEGAHMLTVPVSGARGEAIRDIRIANERWQKKHIGTIQGSYASAPFARLFDRGLRPLLEHSYSQLVELNIAVTEWMFGCLGISCRRVRASDLNAEGAKDDLVISLCQAVGATIYLSGEGARAYQTDEKFRGHGLELRYQQYRNRAYSQCHPHLGFTPDLSAVDLILNLGDGARDVMLAGDEPG